MQENKKIEMRWILENFYKWLEIIEEVNRYSKKQTKPNQLLTWELLCRQIQQLTAFL